MLKCVNLESENYTETKALRLRFGYGKMRKIKRNPKNILQNWEIVLYMQRKVRPERRADISAALVVPHVQVSLEARHSIPSLSLHDLF